MSIIIDGTGTISGVSSTGLTTAQTVNQSSFGTNVAGTGPAFSASQTTPQAIPSSTVTKITYQTEQFDTNNNFSSSIFQPSVAGYYQINATISYNTVTTANPVSVNIFKNAVGIVGNIGYGGGGGAGAAVSTLMYLNGSTDYVEVYSGQYTGSSQNVGSSTFSGSMVRAA